MIGGGDKDNILSKFSELGKNNFPLSEENVCTLAAGEF